MADYVPTRDEAFALLGEYNQAEGLINHAPPLTAHSLPAMAGQAAPYISNCHTIFVHPFLLHRVRVLAWRWHAKRAVSVVLTAL